MLFAQVEPVAVSGIMDFAGKFGFPALLVLVLLWGLWKMLDTARAEREKREDRDEKREEARRIEREADREAHVTALTGNTAALHTLGLAVIETGLKVDSLVKLHDQEIRFNHQG